MTKWFQELFIPNSEPATSNHFWVILDILHQLIKRDGSPIPINQSANMDRHIDNVDLMHPVIKSASHLYTRVVLNEFGNFLVNKPLERQVEYRMFNDFESFLPLFEPIGTCVNRHERGRYWPWFLPWSR